MYNYYDLSIIPIILTRFKVNDVVMAGIPEKQTANQIFKYCEDNDKSCTVVDLEESFERGIKDLPLNALSNVYNYGAIFLNDDPNWFTVYNELNLIKKNNDEFPLVFICNNIFPHKRRDSYICPENIPPEFRKDYSKKFNHENISLEDNFYHAIEENTSKNGVLTAIEDFLTENKSIKVMDIKLINGITILYENNSISQIRLGKLADDIESYILNDEYLSDNLIENKFLINHISKFDVFGEDLDAIDNYKMELHEKEKIIKYYEDKIELHDDELAYKNSQIDGVKSKLSLKDAQIMDIESKLINRENEINNLNDKINQLKIKNNQIENKELNVVNQFSKGNYENTSLNNDLYQNELKDLKLSLDFIKQQYNQLLSKLDNKKYCINCYEEEVNNNHLEIQYLKKNIVTRKIFGSFAYIYLIFKSKPKDLTLNIKLYRALKNSKCFDVGYYLANNEDIRNSKWCKFFSPELHYVCNGFREKRSFNKKFFNRNSKKELLDYIYNCP